MAKDTTSEYRAGGALPQPEAIPYSVLEDTTPIIHKPAAVKGGGLDGSLMTGTILTLDAVNSVAVIDFASGAKYFHTVINTLTYSGGNPATFATLNVGTPVYYDPTAALVAADIHLSLSPLDSAGAANTLFGWVALADYEIPNGFGKTNPYPLGSASVTTTHTNVCILQKGAA